MANRHDASPTTEIIPLGGCHPLLVAAYSRTTIQLQFIASTCIAWNVCMARLRPSVLTPKRCRWRFRSPFSRSSWRFSRRHSDRYSESLRAACWPARNLSQRLNAFSPRRCWRQYFRIPATACYFAWGCFRYFWLGATATRRGGPQFGDGRVLNSGRSMSPRQGGFQRDDTGLSACAGLLASGRLGFRHRGTGLDDADEPRRDRRTEAGA